MAWQYSAADQAGNIVTALQAIAPASLDGPLDRATRLYLIAQLGNLPPLAGVIVRVDNDDHTHCWVDIRRQAFGSYAS